MFEPSGQPDPFSQWAWLARIRRPQGRKGEVFVDLLTDFPEKFAERKHLWLLREIANAGLESEPREVELINHWPHKGGIVLHFAGIDSISAAETLNGLIVAIPRSQRAPLSDGEVYIGDLIGCSVIDVAGPAPDVVGNIVDVDRTAGRVPILVVRSPIRADEILIPFAKSISAPSIWLLDALSWRCRKVWRTLMSRERHDGGAALAGGPECDCPRPSGSGWSQGYKIATSICNPAQSGSLLSCCFPLPYLCARRRARSRPQAQAVYSFKCM